jgi:dTDP-4-amino-4,6-dideoxygalactose transaminase
MTAPYRFGHPVYITRPLLPDLEKLKGKLAEIWESRWLTNGGRQHQLLEESLRVYLKVPGLSLFNNGTIAMIVAVQSLRLSGEVITTPFTFPATPHVLTWNNIKPIFCDIDPVTMTLDAEKIESMITPQTTGILGVHVFGNPCNVEKIKNIADKYGLKIVYDAAHAFGAEINEKGIGAFGDISMFSFHATKLYHTAEGGALTFNDNQLRQRVDFLKNFGIKNEEEVMMPGINGKMNEIQAALGLLVLEMVADEMKKRQRIADTYRKHLSNIQGLSLPEELIGAKSSLQYYNIRINEKLFGSSRDNVHEILKNKYNVFSRKYFFPLCSDYTCYKHLPSSSPDNLPTAGKVVREVLCLPFYGALKDDDVVNICNILADLRSQN